MQTLNRPRTGTRVKYGVVAALYALLGAAVARMLLIQAADPLAGDFAQHLTSARNPQGREYSLFTILYRFMDGLWHSDLPIVAFLVAMVLAGLWLCGVFFRRHSPVKDPLLSSLLGIACYCVDPIFLPWLNPYRVLGVQAGGVWHNPTLLGIKTMLMALVLVYLSICKQMEDPAAPLAVKKLLAFCALLTVATWIKPNLAMSVEPAIAFFLLFDLCRRRGRGFWKLAALAATVVPSLAVIGWQFLVSFANAPAGEESGIAFAPGMELVTWAKSPIWAILQSLAFPLLVLAFSVPQVFKDRKYGFAWAIAGVAYLEHLCLAETGERAGDGNFSWGVQMVMVYLFAASAIRLMEAWPWLREKAWGKALAAAGAVLFLWHTFCGVQYIVLFILKKSYFM